MLLILTLLKKKKKSFCGRASLIPIKRQLCLFPLKKKKQHIGRFESHMFVDLFIYLFIF